MTTEEWYSLKVGDIISNNQGKNHRAVLYSENGYVKIVSLVRSKKEITYCIGDKYLFKKTSIRVKVKQTT